MKTLNMHNSKTANEMSAKNNYTQVCILEGVLMGDVTPSEFEELLLEEHDMRVKFIEEILTEPDVDNPTETGGRNDLIFYMHSDDVKKYAVKRLSIGIRWIEDAMSTTNGYYDNPIYPERFENYKTW